MPGYHPATGLNMPGGAAGAAGQVDGQMPHFLSDPVACSKRGVRLAQTMQVGPCIPVGVKLEKAEVGPTSGPTWRLSRLRAGRGRAPGAELLIRAGRGRVTARELVRALAAEAGGRVGAVGALDLGFGRKLSFHK
jgi:hypothetical protein